jgi:hypothetical protein
MKKIFYLLLAAGLVLCANACSDEYGGLMAGRVLEMVEGQEQGLAGVAVKFRQNGITRAETQTDASGEFVSPLLDEGKYTVEFSKYGYDGDSRTKDVSLKETELVENIVLTQIAQS